MSSIRLPATLAAAALACALPAQGGFRHDVTWLPDADGPVVRTGFVDLDADGFLDIVRLRGDGVETLLQNAASGRFSLGASVPLGGGTGPTLRAFVTGRFDPTNDPYTDIAVLWSNGQVDVLQGDGLGGLSLVSPRPLPTLPLASASDLLAGDVLGNGREELIVLLDGLPPHLLARQASGAFVDVTATNMPTVGYARPHATLADVEGDSDLDLVLCSTNNVPARLFENVGGVFVDVPGAFGAAGLAAGDVLALDLVGSSLPEIVFTRPGNAALPPVVRLNLGGTFPNTTLVQNLVLEGVLEMAPVDVDRDGLDDIVFLESTGRLGFALRGSGGVLQGQPMPASSTTEPITLLRPHPGRVAFAVADLEGDGDRDLVAVGDGRASLLLHGPGSTFYDVERLAFPSTYRGLSFVGAVVDRDGNGDVDFVGLRPSGAWDVYDNDGSGYYSSPSAAGTLLPVLPPLLSWRGIAPMSLTAPGHRDLVAIGTGLGVPTEIALLAQNGGSWVDDTASRFGGAVTGSILAMSPYPNSLGLDDLIVGTSAGELELHANVGGVLTHQPGAFPSGLMLAGLSELLVADLTSDGIADVLALSTGAAPHLFAGSAGGVFLPVTLPGTAAGDRGAVGDLDHDGDNDVLLWQAGQAGVMALRQGTSGFAASSPAALGTSALLPSDIAIVAVDGTPRVVVARTGGHDIVLSWNGSGFAGPIPLPSRGTTASHALLVSDVDRDGDDDLLVLREHETPLVLANSSVHLQQLGSLQSGRSGQVFLRGPSPGALSIIAFGLPLNQMTPWGLARLDPSTTGTVFLGPSSTFRESFWNLNLPPGLPPIRFPLQAAWLTLNNEVVLSGLEFLEIVP